MPEDLTTLLARRVMGWGIAPERFLLGRRGWIPRWRFQPTERLEDAFRLLEEAVPRRYSMGRNGKGSFWVRVQIGQETGHAQDLSKPRAITLAVARALKLPVD
jgi:Phage ABA sandwich domain